MSVFINLIFKLQSIGMFIALLSLIVLTPLTRLSAAVVYPAAVGNNDYYQCEVGTTPNVVSIAAGGYHTVVLKSNKTVVATGDWTYGQCDVEGWINILQVAAGGMHTLGVRANHAVRAVGDNTYKQCAVTGWTNIKAVAGGYWHSVGLHIDGTVVACGDNRYGQGNVSTWTNISAIAAGHWHTVGLRTDGTVVSTGDNADGQMNVGNWTNIKAIGVGHIHTVGLRTDGTVVATGDNSNNQCDVADWANIVAIAVGQWHTVGLKADGTVVATGDKYDGQCNVSGVRHGTAIAAGYNHTAILSSAAHFTITSTAGDNGKVEPSGRLAVASDATVALNAFPAAGYVVDTWAIDGDIVQEGGLSYSLNNVTYDASVSVSFKLSAEHWTVTPSSGAHGTISPNLIQTVENGSDITFTATPDAKYLVDSWSVDGTVAQQGGNSFTLANVVANHAVAVSFKLGSWTVTPSNGAHGSISPSEAQTVAHGSDVTFTAAPDANYLVDSWSVDGVVAQQGGKTYTLNNVTDDMAVEVTFTLLNQAPYFAPGSDVTVLEDAATYSATWATEVSAGPENESGQTMVFLVSNANTALFSAQPAISPTGVLTFTPAANAHGSAMITVQLQDNGGTTGGGVDTSDEVTFTITIAAVNDIPTLNNIADPAIIIGGNAGEQTVGISGISAGPANESAQTLIITATSNNTLMIPSVAVDYTPGNSTANLRFTPATGIGGIAVITVTVTDNGGTANGGVNTVSKSFSQEISVLLGTLALSFDKTTPQLNGTAIQITATVPGGTNKTYKFSATEYYSKVVTPLGTGSYQTSNTVSWTPNLSGRYTIRVDVLDGNNYTAVNTFTYYIYRENLLPGDTVNLIAVPASPQQDNAGAIALTANVANGTGDDLLYKFTATHYYTKVVENFGDNLNPAGYQIDDNTANWTPTSSGRYTLRVDVLDPSNNYKASKSITYYIYRDSLLPGDTVTLTPNLASPRPDTVGPIELTANVVNGTGDNLLYKFTATHYVTKVAIPLGENTNTAGYQYDDNTANWTPTSSGRYTLRVDVLDPSNGYKASTSVTYYIYSESLLPGDTVTLTPNLASPRPDTVGPIALTADVVNGTGDDLLYKFTATHYYTNVVENFGENLNPAGYQIDDTTANWTPTVSGRYTLRVDVLDPSNSYKASKSITYYIYRENLFPGDMVTLTPNLSSPRQDTVGPIALTADVVQGTGDDLLYKFTATHYYTKVVENFGDNLDPAGYQSDDTTANWTPTSSGRYTLRVDVLDPSNGYKASKSVTYYIYSESLLPGDTVNLTTDIASPQLLSVGNIKLTANVVANHSVAVSFKLGSWTVTPSSGAYGSISPNVAQTVAQTVAHGGDVTFTAAPFDNYLVDNWLLDGVVVRQGGESFILSNVVADHTLAVTFKLRSWTVTATVGEHGSINPSGVQTVLHGSSVSFIASPQEGYLTANWLVDGIVVQQGGNDFVLSQVIDNVTVSVTFELAQVNDVTLAITPGITLVGKPVTLTATATGIINAEYQFFRQVGNEWVSISDNSYSESSSMQWTTNEVGIEHFRVHVREAGSTAYFTADASVQVLAALSAVNLTVEPPSIFIGQEVLLSAAPAGGELVEYQFYYRTGVQWTSLTGGRYLRDNICRWTPQNTGNYIIRVNAREVGTTKYLPAEATLRVNLPLSGVSLTAQSPIVLISKSVVLNAVPQGGSNLEYQFFLKDGENWQSLSDDQFVSENIASFLPDAPGSYQFQVLVREVGAVDSYASEVSVAVNPALSELELSAEPSPVLQGREVTFTASAVGGAQVEYQFYRHLPTGWESLTGGKYLPSNECRWTPADAGTFLIRVNARELGSKSYMPAEMLLTVNPALSGVTLKSQAARVLIGKSILLNAIPVGGSNVEYQFYRKEGTVWVSLNDGQYIPDNRFDLLPTATGKIQFRVVAREQGTVTTFSGTVTVTVVSPLSKVTITALPAQAVVGETITLKAVPTGGASVQYQFYRRLAASWESLTGGKYLTSASCNWTPTEVGNYLIRVNAREVGSSIYFPAEVLVSVKLPLSGVLLSTQASPMVLGKSIILTANPQNGGNVEYQFYKKDGENWLSLTEGLFVSDNIYSWLPADAGNYTFRVQARDVGGTALFDAEASIQVNPALSSVSFIADPSPAMLGDVVSLTAEAAGGASLEYQFYYRSGTAWVSLTGGQYRPLNNCQWTPAAAGSYLLRVNVREVGTLTYLPTEIILTVDPPLSGVTLEAQSSSVLLGKSVILNAVPEGGGIVEYQFSRLEGVNSTSLDKNNSGQFAAENSMSWIPSAPGSYRFKVLARSTGSTKEFDSEVVVTVLPALSKVTLQAEPSSSRPSSAVILTASAVGGMNVEYQFYRRLATGWESLTAGKYLAANVCEWVPSTAGSYLIRVNAREVGSKVYFPAEVTVVVSDQLSGVSLTAQPNPCLFSNSITLQAAPQQGLMVEYQFYRWHESQWESLTDGQFVTSASCPYTPPVEGENRFRVTAREVGATQSYSAEVSVQVNRPLNAVSLAVRPSNVVQGNDITLIATAHGGGTIEYEFFLWNGSAWQSISGGVFSTAATCNWKANSVGEKMFRVKAREVGTTAIYTAEIIAMVT